MSEDHLEELASLYAFDLLEGGERDRFESALAQNGDLQALVRDLRETACHLAYAVPPSPVPAELKQRVMASIEADESDTVIRPGFRVWNLLPWAIAACLALVSTWLGQRYVSNRTELATVRSRQELAEITAQGIQQQLEAERILRQRRAEEIQTQLSNLTQELGAVRTQLSDRERQLAEAQSQTGDRQRELGESRTQLASAREQLAARDRQLVALNERIGTLTRNAAEAGRQLAESRQQIALLVDEMKLQGDLANLKITALASMLKNLPQAQAIAVWDPRRQEGILEVQKLPPLTAQEDYQIWVVDPQYPIPVDGGVFTVEPTSGSRRVKFTARQPVSTINAFAVTRERKGGVPKAEGPFVLLGK